VGPYEVPITGSQPTPVSGDVHPIVIVLDATTQQAVPVAQVLIRTRNEVDSIEGWARAFDTSPAPELYEKDATLGATGTWEVKVEASSDLGDILVQLPSVEVREARGSTAGELVFVGVFAVLVLGSVYVWWSIRREQRKRVPIPTHEESQPHALAESDQSDSGKVEPPD